MKKVNTWICGNPGPLDDYNPLKVTREGIAPEILYILNKGPLTIPEIAKDIKKDKTSVEKTMKSLLKINAIRKVNKEYWVNFAIFSKEDQKIILNIGEKYGKQLAYKILEDKTQISNLANQVQCANYIEKEKIIFALVGCFALDWYCLEELEKNNFLIRHKKQPGNRDYILQGGESSNINVYKLFWGSHSVDTGKFIFTSFGDEGGPRSALPDILWQALDAVSKHINGDPDLREMFANILSLYSENLLNDCGKLLESLSTNREMRNIKNRSALFDFLKKLEYISQEGNHYKVKIPIFFPRDRKIINRINKRISKIVCDFLAQKYPEIKGALSKIRPVLNKVPFEEVFVDVWHKIFGHCNMFLAEEGFMYDPPETLYHARYLCWVTIKNEKRAVLHNSG
jgi:hypothetical protein